MDDAVPVVNWLTTVACILPMAARMSVMARLLFVKALTVELIQPLQVLTAVAMCAIWVIMVRWSSLISSNIVSLERFMLDLRFLELLAVDFMERFMQTFILLTFMAAGFMVFEVFVARFMLLVFMALEVFVARFMLLAFMVAGIFGPRALLGAAACFGSR